MDPQNFWILNVHSLWSPPFVCPYCPRHLCSRGGCKIHIETNHQAESGLNGFNLYDPPSPIPYLSPLPPTPIPSNFMLPPSDYTPGPFSSNYTPSPSSNYVLPPTDYGLSPFSNHLSLSLHGGFEFTALYSAPKDDLDAAPGMNDPQVPDTSSITHAYHPKLDGTVAQKTVPMFCYFGKTDV